MDEQQLTHPEEIQWYERQKQLSHYLTSEEPAQLATALELFLDQHVQLHSPNRLAQSALAGLSDEQWRLKPGQGTNSVAWLLLHMVRIEDATFNLLVMERAQVFAEWFEQLGFDRRDVGTGMSDEEVLELSKTIHLWWLLCTSVRKMDDFAFDFCIFSELRHSQKDDRGPTAAA